MADNLPDNVAHCAFSLNYTHISNHDVIDVIKNLKPSEAFGFDQISHILLKKSLIILTLPVYTLFDKSFHLGQCPDNLKWLMLYQYLKVKILVLLTTIVQCLY